VFLEKPLYAIVDNASIHQAKTIQEGMTVLEEKGLKLYFLPPYSPELNLFGIYSPPLAA